MKFKLLRIPHFLKFVVVEMSISNKHLEAMVANRKFKRLFEQFAAEQGMTSSALLWTALGDWKQSQRDCLKRTLRKAHIPSVWIENPRDTNQTHNTNGGGRSKYNGMWCGPLQIEYDIDVASEKKGATLDPFSYDGRRRWLV